ncbi:MAG: hypothetical protein AB8B65_11255 [Kordia sp.]|uniref:hypothetical protein n=1 Tax=Kordia sp. TaxID=1965332 RepID=UPI00385CF32E
MKKRNLKSLDLHKKSISTLNDQLLIKGGTSGWGSAYCTMPTMQCPSVTGGSCKATDWKCQ